MGEIRSFRRGGDEFVLLGIGNQADEIATVIQDRLYPLMVNVEGREISVTTSFGYTLLDKTISFQENLRRADDACKAAKWTANAHIVKWKEGIETGYNARLRCPDPECRSQFSISVSPEKSKSLGPLKCMVCGHDLQ